jgi:hypothetical protein
MATDVTKQPLEIFKNHAAALQQQKNEKYLSVKGEDALTLPGEAWDKLSELVRKQADKPEETEKQAKTLLQHPALLSQPEGKALFENLLQTKYAKQHNVTAALPEKLEELQKVTPLHLVGVEVRLSEVDRQLSQMYNQPTAKTAESRQAQRRELRLTVRKANKLERLKVRIARRINPKTGISARDVLSIARAAVSPRAWVRVGWKLAKMAVASIRDGLDERLLNEAAKINMTEKAPATKITPQEKSRQSSREFSDFLNAQKQHEMLRKLPGVNDKVLAALSEEKDGITRLYAAIHHNTDAATLAKLSTDKSSIIRVFVASHCNTDAKTLSALSADKDGGVRACVASNPNTRAITLAGLRMDKSDSVRACAENNPNAKNITYATTLAVAQAKATLMSGCHPDVRQAAATSSKDKQAGAAFKEAPSIANKMASLTKTNTEILRKPSSHSQQVSKGRGR